MAATVVTKGTCNLDALKRIVCKFLKKEVEISNPLLQPAVPRGGNFVSDAWRVSFFMKDKDTTTSESVIVKAKPEDESQNQLMHTDIAFKNEILAYENIIPTLNNYVCSPIRVPKYLHGDINNIVLEDMAKSGFHTVHKKLAVEWNQVWSPIQEIAKLHAASICMQHLDKPKFDSMKYQIIDVPHSESTPLGEMQTRVLDTVQEVLKAKREDKKYIDLLDTLKSNAWKNQKEIVQKEVPFRVINHGSLWINNVVFRGDMATILDLQHIVYSTPANDLSFFMYVNLDPRFFSNNRKNLLRFYLLNLHSQITNRLGDEATEVVKPLDYDWIDREFRRCSLYAYMMAQWIMPAFYWSDAVFRQMESRGGLEKMSLTERMEYLTSEEKDRMINLTKLFVQETNKN